MPSLDHLQTLFRRNDKHEGIRLYVFGLPDALSTIAAGIGQNRIYADVCPVSEGLAHRNIDR